MKGKQKAFKNSLRGFWPEMDFSYNCKVCLKSTRGVYEATPHKTEKVSVVSKGILTRD